MTTLAPRTASEVADAVRWAAAAGEALEVVAGGTRRGLGRPVDAAHRLDVSALSGVLAHEPEELILTALPGTALVEIEALLAGRGQCLAFEPPRLAVDEGEEGTASRARTATLGGTVATGLSGPRRPKAGAVRDHVLGVSAVSGRGESFVGGGRVVKNVTGYDVPKLLTGSYGTLAVLTEITVKVLPLPEDTRTLVVGGMSAAHAVRAMSDVLQSAADASGACYLPAGVVRAGFDVPGLAAAQSATAFRLEGVTPSVEFRLARLREMLTDEGSLTVLDSESSLPFWREVRDVAPFSKDTSRSLWRICVPPAAGADVLARIDCGVPGAEAFLDWGGGLIWLQVAPSGNAENAATVSGADGTREATARREAAAIRSALGDTGGHATLVRAPAAVRSAVEVFQPQPDAVAALSARVKQQFDPKKVLNPGRMYAGV